MELIIIIAISIAALFFIFGIITLYFVMRKLNKLERAIIYYNKEIMVQISEMKIKSEEKVIIKEESEFKPQDILKQMEEKKKAEQEAKRIEKIKLEYEEINKTIASVESENIKNILKIDLNKLISENPWLEESEKINFRPIVHKIQNLENLKPKFIEQIYKPEIVEHENINQEDIQTENIINIEKVKPIYKLPSFKRCKYCSKTYNNVELHEETCPDKNT